MKTMLLLLPLAGALAAGCRAADAPTPNAAPPADTKSTAPQEQGPINVNFALAQNVSGRGRVVAFSITARNASAEPQVLQFTSGQSFNITATLVGQKNPVWEWAAGKMFTRALRRETLAPGEQKTWTATWEGTDNLGNPAPRGQYLFEASLKTNGTLKAPPLTLDVQPEGIRDVTPTKNDLDMGPVAKTEADKAVYKRGETAKFTLTVRNEETQTTALNYPSGQRYDFIVRPAPKGKYDPKQAEVWRWSGGRAFTMMISMQEFKPGAVLTFSDTWNLTDSEGKPVAPGTYSVEGVLAANRGIAAPPLIVEVQ